MSSENENSGDGQSSRGYDLARKALEDARTAAKANGKAVGQGRKPAGRVSARPTRRGWSGSGPDQRDPQAFGALISNVARSRGWSGQVAEGTVMGQWSTVVGEDISAHAEPTALKDGVLSISAESTAWATQLRHMQPQILAKIAAAVGNGVVKKLRITGPLAPSWRKGERNVKGRGPRDTYG